MNLTIAGQILKLGYMRLGTGLSDWVKFPIWEFIFFCPGSRF